MIQRLTRALAPTLALVLALAGFAAAQERPATLADALRATPEASALTALFDESGLLDELSRPGRFTFFAPSDAALERLDPEVVAMLRRDRGALDVVVRNHLALGATPFAALQSLDALTTLESTMLPIRVDERGVRIAGVRLAGEGIATGNGVLYLVDRVLMPTGSWMLKDLLAGPDAP
jgi:uncharacterized surface protein with fasciclin (FAS1) repeats